MPLARHSFVSHYLGKFNLYINPWDNFMYPTTGYFFRKILISLTFFHLGHGKVILSIRIHPRGVKKCSKNFTKMGEHLKKPSRIDMRTFVSVKIYF